MPRVVDRRPRRVADKDPLAGLLGYDITAAAEQAGQGIRDFMLQIRDTWAQWLREATGIDLTAANEFFDYLVSEFLSRSQLDLSSPQKFVESLGDLLRTGAEEVFNNSVIAISRIGNIIQDLINGAGDFLNADSVKTNPFWSWDSVMPGFISGGSIRATANGTQQVMRSEPFRVFPGQTLELRAASQWTGASATAGSNPVKVGFTPFDADGNPLADVIRGSLQPSGDHGWQWIPVADKWPVPAGVKYVSQLLILDSGATAGTFRFSNASAWASNLLDLGLVKDLREMVDAVGGAVNSGVHDIEERLQAITADGKITASEILGLIQQAQVSGLAIMQTIINQILDILNGIIVTPINSLVQGIKDWFGLNQNKTQALNGSGQIPGSAITGAINLGNIPKLPPAKVQSPIGSADIGQDLKDTWDHFWNAVFGGSASGKTPADVGAAAATLKQTADDARAAAIYASDLVNLPRLTPRWLSTGIQDDVSFPIICAQSLFTPANRTVVLIPITPEVPRTYRTVKFGLVRSSGQRSVTTKVGLYRVDASGNISLSLDLGNVTSLISATSNVQTLSIPEPGFSVEKGETVFIGVLQIGINLDQMFTAPNIPTALETVQAVPLFFTQDGGAPAVGDTLPIAITTSVEFTPAWGALGEARNLSTWTDYEGGNTGMLPRIYDIESAGRRIYLAGVGQGGGGGGGDGGWNMPGEGGGPGTWAGRLIERGVDIPWSVTQIRVEADTSAGIGSGGVTERDGKPGYAVVFRSVPDNTILLTCPGGRLGRLAYGSFYDRDPVGYGPGNFAFGGRLFLGGTNTAATPPRGAQRGEPGKNPGGGGAGGGGGIGGNAGVGGEGGPGVAAIKVV